MESTGLGWRAERRSVLLPLAVVLLPGWWFLTWIIYNSAGTVALSDQYHQVLGRNLMAWDAYQEDGDAGMTGWVASWQGFDNGAEYARDVIKQFDREDWYTESILIDHAMMLIELGRATPEEKGCRSEASRLLKRVQFAAESPYYEGVIALLQNRELSPSQGDALSEYVRARPTDWWATHLALRHGMPCPWFEDGTYLQKARWHLRAAVVSGITMTSCAALGLLLLWPTLKKLQNWQPQTPAYARRLGKMLPVVGTLIAFLLADFCRILVQVGTGRLMVMVSLSPEGTHMGNVHLANLLWMVGIMLSVLMMPPLMRVLVAPGWGTAVRVLGIERRYWRDSRNWKLGLACGLCLFFVTSAAAWGMALAGAWPSITDELRSYPSGWPNWMAAVLVVHAVVVAPWAEECVFRGFLLSSFRNAMPSWMAIAASSLIFAASHAYQFTGFVGVFLFGILVSCIRLRTGSLIPGMVAHGTVNLILMVTGVFLV